MRFLLNPRVCVLFLLCALPNMQLDIKATKVKKWCHNKYDVCYNGLQSHDANRLCFLQFSSAESMSVQLFLSQSKLIFSRSVLASALSSCPVDSSPVFACWCCHLVCVRCVRFTSTFSSSHPEWLDDVVFFQIGWHLRLYLAPWCSRTCPGHLLVKAWSFLLALLLTLHVSDPYRRTDLTFVLNILILFWRDNALEFQAGRSVLKILPCLICSWCHHWSIIYAPKICKAVCLWYFLPAGVLGGSASCLATLLQSSLHLSSGWSLLIA